MLSQDYISLNRNAKDLSQLDDFIYAYISSKDDEFMTSYYNKYDVKIINKFPINNNYSIKKIFIISLEERLRLITESTSNKEYRIAIAECHKIKALAGEFGFPEITEYAGTLELIIKNCEYDTIHTNLDDLTKVIKTALGEN